MEKTSPINFTPTAALDLSVKNEHKVNPLRKKSHLLEPRPALVIRSFVERGIRLSQHTRYILQIRQQMNIFIELGSWLLLFILQCAQYKPKLVLFPYPIGSNQTSAQQKILPTHPR